MKALETKSTESTMSAAFENETLEIGEETVALSETIREVDSHNVRAALSKAIAESKANKKGTRVKRTEAQMIASMGGSAMKESAYVLDRISKLEDKISELMGAVSPKSREYILSERPDLSKY